MTTSTTPPTRDALAILAPVDPDALPGLVECLRCDVTHDEEELKGGLCPECRSVVLEELAAVRSRLASLERLLGVEAPKPPAPVSTSASITLGEFLAVWRKFFREPVTAKFAVAFAPSSAAPDPVQNRELLLTFSRFLHVTPRGVCAQDLERRLTKVAGSRNGSHGLRMRHAGFCPGGATWVVTRDDEAAKAGGPRRGSSEVGNG